MIQVVESSSVVTGRCPRCDMPNPMGCRRGRYFVIHCARCSRYALAETLQAACEKWNSYYDMPISVVGAA